MLGAAMNDDRQMIEMLLAIHDGDDRCGCLAQSVRAALDADTEWAQGVIVELLQLCIANHPAGSTHRQRGNG